MGRSRRSSPDRCTDECDCSRRWVPAFVVVAPVDHGLSRPPTVGRECMLVSDELRLSLWGPPAERGEEEGLATRRDKPPPPPFGHRRRRSDRSPALPDPPRRQSDYNARRRCALDREMPFMDSLGREPQGPDVRSLSSPGGATSRTLRGLGASGNVAPLGLHGVSRPRSWGSRPRLHDTAPRGAG